METLSRPGSSSGIKDVSISSILHHERQAPQQISPWKAAGGVKGANVRDFHTATSMLSKKAAELKDLLSLQKQHASLLKLYKQTESSLQKSRAEERRAKEAFSASARDLDLCRRKLEEVSSDHKVLQIEVEDIKEYARKMENRLTTSVRQFGPAALDRYAKMGFQIDQLKGTRSELTAQLEARSKEVETLLQENSVLKDAVTAREEELGLRVGGDPETGKASILLSIASAREDLRRVQLELANAHVDRESLRAQIQDQIESKQACEELRKRADSLVKELEQSQASLGEMSVRCDVLTRRVNEGNARMQEMQEEREALLDRVEELERPGTAIPDQGKSHTHTDEASEIEYLRGQLRTESVRAQAAESALNACRARSRELMEEVGSLNRDVDQLTEENQRLQRDNESKQRVGEECEGGGAEVSALREELWRERERREDAERALQEERELARERETHGGGAVEQSNLEKECKQLRQHAESLARSKTLLQRTMLEQLTRVREQLESSKEQCRTLESENDHLKDMLSESQRSSQAPSHGYRAPQQHLAMTPPARSQTQPNRSSVVSPPSGEAPPPRDALNRGGPGRHGGGLRQEGGLGGGKGLSLLDIANAEDIMDLLP